MWLPVLIACIVLAAWLSCSGAGAGQKDVSPPDPAAVAAEADEPPARADIRGRLEDLVKSPPPGIVPRPGAMCYKPAMPAPVAEYVCPDCGLKTLYERYTSAVSESIPACRRLLPTVKGLALRLDEREFCRTCMPDAKDPALVLVVDYGGGRVHRFRGVTPDDLVLIREFLEGSETHAGPRDSVTALRKHLPRLRELLGIPGGAAGQQDGGGDR